MAKSKKKIEKGLEKLGQPDKKRKHFVMFSGGCDSTLILRWLLYYGCKKITALSVKHPAMISSLRAEKAQAKIIAHLEAKFNIGIVHTKVYCDACSVKGDGFSQQAMWAFLAAYGAEDKFICHFGYLRMGDIWHSRGDWEWLFIHTYKLMGKVLNWNYPLQWHYKEQVIDMLVEAKMMSLVTTCEDEEDLKKPPCGKCLPCRNLLKAVQDSGVAHPIALLRSMGYKGFVVKALSTFER